MINRETITKAIFDKLKVSSKFVTSSRRVKHWSDVPMADQPALFMSGGNQNARRSPGFDCVWTLRFTVYLYANTRDDQTRAPGEVLNPMIDAIEALLKPDNIGTNKCTLGGLVEHAWIEGDIETDEGLLGDQGVVVIPIVALVPSA